MAYTPTHLASSTATGTGTSTLYTVATGEKVILSQAYLSMGATNSATQRLYIERASGAEQSLIILVNHTTGVNCGVSTEMVIDSAGLPNSSGGLANTVPAATTAVQAAYGSIKGIVLEAGDMLKLTKGVSHTHHVSVSGVVIS